MKQFLCCKEENDSQFSVLKEKQIPYQIALKSPNLYILGATESGICDILKYATNYSQNDDFIISQEDYYEIEQHINQQQTAKFKLWCSDEDYRLNHSQIMENTFKTIDCFILVFSLDKLSTFDVVKSYIRKIQKESQQGAVVIVGTEEKKKNNSKKEINIEKQVIENQISNLIISNFNYKYRVIKLKEHKQTEELIQESCIISYQNAMDFPKIIKSYEFFTSISSKASSNQSQFKENKF